MAKKPVSLSAFVHTLRSGHMAAHSDSDVPMVAGAPEPPAADGPSRVIRRDRLGGLIHEYAQVTQG